MISRPVLSDEDVEGRVLLLKQYLKLGEQIFRGTAKDDAQKRVYYLVTHNYNAKLTDKMTDTENNLARRGRCDIGLMQIQPNTLESFLGDIIFIKS